VTPSNAIAIPAVAGRFREYHAKHAAWGSLHIVLDDLNVNDANVWFCIENAREKEDIEGEELGFLLLNMSKTQRKKIAQTC
jgi:hypothetical protein